MALSDVRRSIDRVQSGNKPHIQRELLATLLSSLDEWVTRMKDLKDAADSKRELERTANDRNADPEEKAEAQQLLSQAQAAERELQENRQNLRQLENDVKQLQSKVKSLL